MALTPGARLGAFEILAPLGAGGMGEVYRARDTRLGRDVAIKVLPQAFIDHPDRLARFEREARVLASLNHPNIAQIYGLEKLEEQEGTLAIVMELVEGETLADRLGAKPKALTVSLTIAIARQIADALDAAHEKGIVHRDLKPPNIAITPDGVVKVLDFGLAKLDSPSSEDSKATAGFTNSPTITVGTRDGTLLGTAAYMSPEQARGQAVDKRTDIWAFGCLLYEMLTGRSALAGDTIADTLVAILEREPDWTAIPPATPAALVDLARRCLEKNPKRRLRDIGDARAILEGGAFTESPSAVAVVARPTPLRVAGSFAGGVAMTLLAVLAWQRWAARQPQAPGEVRLQRLTDSEGLEEAPALSPDGKTVAFVASAGGHRQIWVRLLAGGNPLQLTRDEVDHQQPRWTPDSSAVIYYSPPPTVGEQGSIWEIAALGGVPRRIASAVSSGDVSHDGSRVAVFQINEGRIELTAVARDGSRVDRVREVEATDRFRTPRWSPDDTSIAFSHYNPLSFDERIYVVGVSGGGKPREVAGGTELRGYCWTPDGTGLVYSSAAGSTIAYPPTFNLRMHALDGSVDRQLTFGDDSFVDPDMRGSGTLVASRIRMQSDVWRFPTSGSAADNVRMANRVTHQTGQAQTPSLGPDGSELVYLSDTGGHGNLWIAKTDGSGVRQLTFERDPKATIGVPVWSPANMITFILVHDRGGAVQWLISPDGSGMHEFVRDAVWSYWSGDGKWLYYVQPQGSAYCIRKSPGDGGAAVTVRCDNAVGPAISGDGSTLYYFTPTRSTFGGSDFELRVAQPENGPSRPLARIAADQVPTDLINAHAVLSPDGRWLALPLTNGTTSNLTLISTADGHLRQVTDFGQRPTLIARRVSWSPDGRYLYAAVADMNADVVLLDGLMKQRLSPDRSDTGR